MKDKALWVAFRNSLQVSIVEQYSALEGETLKVIYGKLILTHWLFHVFDRSRFSFDSMKSMNYGVPYIKLVESIILELKLILICSHLKLFIQH